MDLKRFRRLAREVDEQHREAMRTIHDDIGLAVTDVDDAARDSRRSFLRGLGLGGTVLTVGGTVVAMSTVTAGAQATTTQPGTTTTEPPKQPTNEDLLIIVFAQSLELAAVEVYGAAAETGKISEEVLPVALAFRDHHLQHAQAFAGLAGKASINRPNEGLVDAFAPQIERAADQAALLTIAFELENAAASTYTAALGELRGLNPAATVANILPIEARHAVVLGEALGLDLDEYVPSFEDPEQAVSPDQYPVIER